MARQLLRTFLVQELTESDDTIEVAGVISSVTSLNNAIENSIITKIPKEPDVYLNNYYELVVPQYSSETFRRHFRMSRECMQILINEVTENLFRKNVDVDKMIVPLQKKVHVTIWMLANHAVSFRSTSDLFGLSKGTAHKIFMEICSALCNLRDAYITWPNLQKQLRHAEKICENTNFPGVIGAIDGCHIPIKAPSHNGYDFFNRKQFHSVVLQAVCDYDLKFINIYVGMTGRAHDARIFRVSPLLSELENGLVREDLHLLGDSAYPSSIYLLVPYRDTGHLTNQERRYNTVHSGIRSCIERAFGLLKNKFRRLRYLDMSLTDDIPVVIAACCVLHNFILHYDGMEVVETEGDEEYLGVQEEQRRINREGEIKRARIAENL